MKPPFYILCEIILAVLIIPVLAGGVEMHMPTWPVSSTPFSSSTENDNFRLLFELETEKRHTQLQLLTVRRLLYQTGALPTCEFNVGYSVLRTMPNVEMKISIANNRELDATSWQLVYRYVDYKAIKLANVSGAIAISSGSAAGAPVRLVDSFIDGGSGISSGSNYSFTAQAAFIHLQTTGNESLLIQSVNVNGLQCSQLLPSQSADRLTLQQCSETLDALASSTSDDSGSSSGDAKDQACFAAFCCGYILFDPNVPPPVLDQAKDPAASVEQPKESEDRMSGGESPAASPELPQPQQPPNDDTIYSPPAMPSPSSPPQQQPSERQASLRIALLAGGVSGMVLVLAVIMLLLRRKHNKKMQQQAASTAKPKQPSAVSDVGDAKKQDDRKTADETASTTATTTTASQNTVATLAQALAGNLGSMAVQALTRKLSGSLPTFPRPASANSDTADTEEVVAQTPEAQLQPQEVLLYEQLGSGAFGTVYRGQYKGQQVAVKVMTTACSSNSRELHSFKREVAVLSRLRHENIIAFLAACTVPPNICIIEELASGGSLHQFLHGKPAARRECPLPYNRLLEIACDVASAMQYLHPKVVHRDLKAHNVLLDAKGRAKVCDFGIAKFKDRTFISTVNNQAGTPAYMAPEIFDGGQATEKVDVYSFGVLLWEMHTGKIPWSNVSPMQMIYYVACLQQRPPLPQDTPAPLRELIEACWADLPHDRPAFTEILPKLQMLRATHEKAATATAEAANKMHLESMGKYSGSIGDGKTPVDINADGSSKMHEKTQCTELDSKVT